MGAFTALTRLQVRSRVQNLLRDDGYPISSMNEALERIITEINNSGRYRFQETSVDISLVQGTASYAVTTNTFLGEIDVIYAPSTADAAPLSKMEYGDALTEGRFASTAAQGIPSIYCFQGVTSTIYVDPIPDGTANAKTLRIFGYSDLTPPTSDSTAITVLPARYHPTLLVYGVLSDIAPGMQIRSGDGYVPAAVAYQKAFKSMQLQEKWAPHIPRELKRDRRWASIGEAGMVSGVRPTSDTDQTNGNS